MTKAKNTRNALKEAIERASFILKSAGRPLKAKELNTVLKGNGFNTLNPATLAKYFKAVPVKGDKKVKFAYTNKLECKKDCKAACEKDAKKACKKETKKPCKKSCKKPVKKACSAKENTCCESQESCTAVSQVGDKTVGCLHVNVEGQFNVHKYNKTAVLHNLLVECPEARDYPNLFVIMAGGDGWPEVYNGIPVVSNRGPGAAGAMLVHKRYLSH